MQKLAFEDFYAWKQDPIAIGLISLTWQEVENLLHIRFDEDCDDLGRFKYAVLKSQNETFYLLTARSESPIGDKVTVELRANNPDPAQSLHNFLREIGLNESHIEWLNTDFLERGLWRIMRQDDNGNVFVIGHYYDEDSAGRICKDLEERGHKQHYWFEKISHPQAK